MKKIILFVLTPFLLTACSLSDGASPGPRDAASRSVLGNASAPILVEEFSDLQCPACAFISPQVEQVIRDNATIAKFYYYHFPLPQHSYAFLAAEAAECAGDQGQFWDYIALVFKNQKDLNGETILSLAQNLPLNQTVLKTCVENREKKKQVLQDMAEGRRRGVNATPTLYVNGKQVQFTTPDSFDRYLKSLASAPQTSD